MGTRGRIRRSRGVILILGLCVPAGAFAAEQAPADGPAPAARPAGAQATEPDALRRARAAVEARRADLRRAEADLRRAEADLRRVEGLPAPDPEATTLDGEVALAQADLTRARDRSAWSDGMFAKGYVSKGRNVADRLAAEAAKVELDQAEARRDASLKAEEPGRAEARPRNAEGRPDAEAMRLDGEIVLARAELTRARGRMAWSDAMLAKGYVSEAQNLADRHALDLAKLKLEQAEARRALILKSKEAGRAEAGDDGQALDGEVALARSQLMRAEQRRAFALEVPPNQSYSQPGSQVISDKLNYESAKLRLEEAIARREVFTKSQAVAHKAGAPEAP